MHVSHPCAPPPNTFVSSSNHSYHPSNALLLCLRLRPGPRHTASHRNARPPHRITPPETATTSMSAAAAGSEAGQAGETETVGDGAGGGDGRDLDRERQVARDNNTVTDEVVLDELDDLFALLAAQRRGEMLFAEELGKPDDEINFLRAAMYIAMHRRPDLQRVEDAEMEIAELAADLEKTLPPNPADRFPLRTLKAIGRYMFEELGFQGNQEEFYDPRNSCLDEVLARRKGIPITLSLVYMELARRVGMPMVGVNLPAHFMIRPVVDEMEVLVDCFRGGEILFVEDVEEMLKKHYTMGDGETVTIDRSFFQDEDVKPRAFFTRMLTNLKQIYFNRDEYASALQIIGYQSHCAPDANVLLYNRRDGGICLFLMQRYEEAVEELTGYLKDSAEGPGAGGADRQQVVQMVTAAQDQLARAAARNSVERAVGAPEEVDDE
mmetsp:Transcript_14545/g.23952  ORF Transcript_14545/g.23952 Transcript_14545/m.23952 type:complete len:437 (+) Transcript_14545:265-1575(+)